MDLMSLFNGEALFRGAGIGASIFGSLAEGDAAEEWGRMRQQAAQVEAAQMETAAGQAQAVAQRNADEEHRKADLVMSRALAVAAASGGGASDPTVTNIISRIAGEGTYRGMMALYAGEEEARDMRNRARATRYSGEVSRYEGEQMKRASKLSAIKTAITGAAGMYERFGKSSDPARKNVAIPGDDWDTASAQWQY